MSQAGLQAAGPPISWGPWVRFSRWLVMSPVVWVIVVINVGSAIAGYIYWYGDVIASVSWYYWLFVPDSPLSVTFMAVSLVGFHYGRRWEFLGLLASGTCIKYGLWTIMVWITGYLAGGDYGLMAVLMSISHFGMAVEGLVLWTFLRFRPIQAAIAALFLIANDAVDYGSSYRPRLSHPETAGTVARFTIGLTVAIVVFWAIMAWLSRRRSGRAHGRRAA